MRILRLFVASSIAGLAMLSSPAMAQDSQSDGTSVGYPNPQPHPGPRQPSPEDMEEYRRRQREIRDEQFTDLGCGLLGVLVGGGAAILAAETGPAVPFIGGAAGLYANEICKDLATNGVGGPYPSFEFSKNGFCANLQVVYDWQI